MVKREVWIQRIEAAWRKRSIIWLAGVRRAGKTFLCQSLENVEYFDCELPRIRHMLDDPESFLKGVRGKRIVLDEIHRLGNPSELLKIAADHFPDTRVIATGSSTLSASQKFRDTLTGRKTLIHLPPILLQELGDFDHGDLKKRLLFGGLPPFYMEENLAESEYQEWLSSYWAKDIQELFRLEKRYSFLKFTELILAQSGSQFEASRFASPCEVSRTTISNYLSVLEATYCAYVLRPFSTHSPTEIVSAPKVYGFDTGFVCHSKGWSQLRREDLGLLWEHIILTEILGRHPLYKIQYWRNKQGHEIDFIVRRGRDLHPDAIECKWSASSFEPKSLNIFRRKYPHGRNFVVAQDVDQSYTKQYGDLEVVFVSAADLLAMLATDS